MDHEMDTETHHQVSGAGMEVKPCTREPAQRWTADMEGSRADKEIISQARKREEVSQQPPVGQAFQVGGTAEGRPLKEKPKPASSLPAVCL